MTTVRSKEYATHSGSVYKTGKDINATVVADVTVPGNAVNPGWRKPIRLITVKHANNRMGTYISEEQVELTIGQHIVTHTSRNKDGYTFISLRDIK